MASHGSEFSPQNNKLTVIMPKILIPSAISGQRPGLPFVALTELYYTVLIQLYPGPLWIDNLPQKRAQFIHIYTSLEVEAATQTWHITIC